jgi:hypothetical protein
MPLPELTEKTPEERAMVRNPDDDKDLTIALFGDVAIVGSTSTGAMSPETEWLHSQVKALQDLAYLIEEQTEELKRIESEAAGDYLFDPFFGESLDMKADAIWREQKHPRDSHGRFAPKHGGASGGAKPKRVRRPRGEGLPSEMMTPSEVAASIISNRTPRADPKYEPKHVLITKARHIEKLTDQMETDGVLLMEKTTSFEKGLSERIADGHQYWKDLKGCAMESVVLAQGIAGVVSRAALLPKDPVSLAITAVVTSMIVLPSVIRHVNKTRKVIFGAMNHTIESIAFVNQHYSEMSDLVKSFFERGKDTLTETSHFLDGMEETAKSIHRGRKSLIPLLSLGNGDESYEEFVKIIDYNTGIIETYDPETLYP